MPSLVVWKFCADTWYFVNKKQSLMDFHRAVKHQNRRTCIQKKSPDRSGLRTFSLESWSWRELNPRPNRETIRFLHAYSGLRFSCCGKTRTTNHNLISLDFIPCAEPHETISDLTAPLYRNASEQQLPSDVSSCHLVTGLSQ